MAKAKNAPSPGVRALGWIVFILLILWFAWWVYGKIMLVTGDEQMNSIQKVLAFIVPIIIFVLMLLSRIWPLVAGILMILEGVIAWFQFDLGFDMSYTPGHESFLTLSLPALVIGLLLIIYWQAMKTSRAAAA
jgi:hypothetical protein